MTVPESFQSRSFRFALEILKLYRTLERATDVPRHFTLQVLRAGTATGANVEEAKSASSRRDMAAKYAIGLREARECHYWLRLIKADQPHFAHSIDDRLDECSQLIAVLTPTVRKLRLKQAAETASAIILFAAAVASLSYLISR
jgi:four helix bundle protein